MRALRRLAATLIAGSVALCALGGLSLAHAATLGPLRSDTLLAFTSDTKPTVPVQRVIASDDFSSTGLLAGKVAATGQTWTVHGKMTVAADGTVSGDGGNDTTAVLQVADLPGGVAVTLKDRSGGWKGGLVLASSADSATQLWVIVDTKNTLSLIKLAAGKQTVLASVPVSNAVAGGTLSVTRTAASVTANYRGATLTSTLAPADVTLFDTLWNRVGIYTNRATQLALDDFQVLA